MKNALLITLSIILFFSCKKKDINTSHPIYTVNDTVTLTIIDTAVLSKSSYGYWIVTLNSSATPNIPALTVTGYYSYDLYNNGIYVTTQTDYNNSVGVTLTDILPSNITNPSISNYYYEPTSWHSTSNVFYDLHFIYQ